MHKVFRLSPIGPNRRADVPVVELLLEFDEAELGRIAPGLSGLPERLRRELPDLQVPAGEDQPGPGTAVRFALLAGQLAIALQRDSGHEVSRFEVLTRENPLEAHFWFEHEEVETGEYAVELAVTLISRMLPELEWESGILYPADPPASLLSDYRQFASPRVLPADTAAICAAAARLDVPCVKLDREPYQGLQGDFRVRPNGMLMLGHGRHRHLVDGTICVDRSAPVLPVRDNPTALAAQLPDLLPGGAIRPLETGKQAVTLVAAGAESISATPETRVHDSYHALAAASARRLGVGLLGLSVQAADLSLPMKGGDGTITHIDPAPRLDQLLSGKALDEAAGRFVRWLYPEGAPSRVPVVAVTGTNGKTTTCRLTDRILQFAGHKTALKCSDGLYLDNELQHFEAATKPDVYYLPFERPDIGAVVQEMHFGRIARQGFPWLFCDVGICTNVTTDHIGRLGVDDLDAMAELKRSVVERARTAAVLNFDDPRCRAMIPHLGAKKIWLVSDTGTAEQLRAETAAQHALVVAESVDGKEWIVVYHDERLPLMALDDIPATFNGTARFNVRNAMQAAAAGLALGVSADNVRDALSSFRTDMNMGLGRMNIYDGHPFRVILDFAHNADGIRQVGKFLEKQDIPGRKIMLIAAAGERQEIDIREKGRAAVEYFDHFVVRSYPDPRGRTREEGVAWMSRWLLEAGASPDQITGVPDPDEAIVETLRIARPGDWLVLNWGNGEAQHMWDMITAFKPGTA